MIPEFKQIVASGYDLKVIEQVAATLPAATAAANTSAPVMAAQPSGPAIPQDAAPMLLALLYLDASRYGQQQVVQAARQLLLDKQYPLLHCEWHTEAEALAELISLLSPLDEASQAFIRSLSLITRGLAVYTSLVAHQLIKCADIACAMTMEATRAEMGAFDDRIHSLGRPFPGQIDAAANVRQILAGSGFTTDEDRFAYGYDKKPRVQDALSTRCVPQTHGGVRDIYYWCDQNLQQEWLGHPAWEENYLLEYSFDALIVALTDLGNMSERRAFRLNDTRFSYGLNMNLTKSTAGMDHGYVVVQSTQAALIAEMKVLNLPSAAVKETGACGAYYTMLKLLRALPLLSKVLAVEVLMAAQAMDLVKIVLPTFSFGAGTQAAFQETRTVIPFMESSHYVTPDMIAADSLVAGGMLLQCVETAVGPLA